MELTGWDEAISKLDRLARLSKKEIGPVLFEGGAVLADAVRAQIDALPVDDSSAGRDGDRKGIRTIQKIGLQNGFGISRMRAKDGGNVYDILLGFHGYNGLRSNSYPGGQPNKMIARSLESGTSFMPADPFVSRALSKASGAAEDAMRTKLLDTVEEIAGG